MCLHGGVYAGVMHLSNDVSASDAENIQCGSEAVSANVKCELKMETDDAEPAWTDDSQKRPQYDSASNSPGEGCDVSLREMGQYDVQPCLRIPATSDAENIRERAGEELFQVSRLTTSAGAFRNELQHLCVKEFGNAAPSDVETGSDITRQESYQVSRLDASRPYQKQPQNVDWKLSGSQSKSIGEVGTGQTSGSTIVGHQTNSCERSDELILSTPFGTFHRAPLSFWPAKSAGEQSMRSNHSTSTTVDVTSSSVNRKLCNHKHNSPNERNEPISSQNVTAKGDETRMPREVMIIILPFVLKIYNYGA